MMNRIERTAARNARRRNRSQSPLLKIPFQQLRNRLPPLELLAAEQIELLHEASMDILETMGLEMQDNETLSLWRQAGARVDHPARHVWLDRSLVLELIAAAPPSFTWRARTPGHDLTVGGNNINFAPNGGTVYASDLDRGRRSGTAEDYENLQKLVQLCNVLHFAGEQLIVPQDIDLSWRHLYRLYTSFTLSDKAVMEAAHGRVVCADNLEMAQLVFGQDLSGDPVIGGVINASSPLRYDERMLGGLITYARAGQVTIITPFILAGAMSPITMAAALAQQNAEVLAGIALAQLVRRGAPVIYGGFTTNIDMRNGSPAFGTPEGAWAQAIGSQLARRYHLPYRGNGSLNTSKVPDAQAAYETLWNLWPAVLAHTNFVFHSVGWLEGGLTVSYEKFMIDVENLAMFHRLLADIPINDETLALDMIAEVGPGGHHFGTAHTQARFMTEFYQPFLSDRLNYDSWKEAGELDTVRRANLVWKELLKQYEPPPLDPGLKEALLAYIERRKGELKGVDLYG